MALDLEQRPEVAALLERGAVEGCLNHSDIDALTSSAELTEAEQHDLHDLLEARNIEVSDDCGHADTPPTRYTNAGLSTQTPAALQLFLNEAGRSPLLRPEEEMELAKRIERGALEAKERLITPTLRLVVSRARRYQGTADLP